MYLKSFFSIRLMSLVRLNDLMQSTQRIHAGTAKVFIENLSNPLRRRAVLNSK
jgi:hypothetical protein